MMKENGRENRGRRSRRWIGWLLGVLFVLTVLIGLLVFFVNPPAEKYKNPARYEELLANRKDLRTGFVVFPPAIPDSGMENGPEFYYCYRSSVFDPEVEVFLRCIYSEADYRTELDRLEHYVHELGSDRADEEYEPHAFLRDDRGLFSYPAYIAIMGDNFACEYALITGEQEITYVYFAFRHPGQFKAVPTDCLPEPFAVDLKRDQGMYNIYEFKKHGEKKIYYIEYERSGKQSPP